MEYFWLGVFVVSALLVVLCSYWLGRYSGRNEALDQGWANGYQAAMEHQSRVQQELEGWARRTGLRDVPRL